MLTKRQKQIFDYTKEYIKENDYAPTLEEIKRHFKLSSISTVHQHIETLKVKGYLKKIENQPRSIELNKKKKISDLVKIPLLGTIAAGEPIEVFEDPEIIKVQKNLLSKSGEHYALKVQGESMIDEGIFDGSTVIIRKQPTVENGETAVALINGNEVTLKKIYKEKNGFRLQPANPNLKPIFTKELVIQGKVVSVIRTFEELKTKVEKSINHNPKSWKTTKLFKNTSEVEGENFVTIKNGYENLKKFLDKLNFQEYHFVNSNDICTPMGCVEEMINAIPKDFWKKKNLKILDPCAGNGNFHAYIAQKTKLKNLWFNDVNKKRLQNIKKIFGEEANIMEKNFLDFGDKEEYDLVVANPPYAKFTNGKRTAKNHNLSRDFILKALNITRKNGYILFIVPDNWMSYADNNKVPVVLSNYQFIHLNIHGAKKWFPKVGSSFSWFLLQKTTNQKEFVVDNNYKIKRIEKASIDKNARYIPLYYSNIVKSIIDKTINADNTKYTIQTSSNLHKYTKKELLSDIKDEKHKYKLNHTPSQVVWSEVPHIYQEGWKVFISLTNQYGNFVDNCGMTQSIAFIRCSSKEEAERISEELNNEIYIFLNNITRYGNFNNIRVLQNFPKYKNFKLTQEELNFIKEFNSTYKSKK